MSEPTRLAVVGAATAEEVAAVIAALATTRAARSAQPSTDRYATWRRGRQIAVAQAKL